MSEQPMDTPEYEALELLDYGTENDVLAAAVAYGRAALPEWEPRAGNTEMVLLESLALILGVEVMAIQMLPGRLVEHLMVLHGVTRSPGTLAVGRVQFNVTASAPLQVIPAGTRLRHTIEATDETVDYLTREPLEIITSEALTGEVDVVAEEYGTTGNAVPAGTRLDVVDTLPFVERAELTQQTSGGQGPEDDGSFQGRSAARLSRLTSTLVLADHFRYAALEDPNVGRALVLDLTNPQQPGTEAPGHVTIAVTDRAGQPVAPQIMDSLASTIAAQALASLSIHVIAPTYTPVDFDITVRGEPDYTVEQVQASVTEVLTRWLDPLNWGWAGTVGQYATVAKVAAAPGVAEVLSVPATQALAGAASLPVLGTVTVTVQ